MGCSGARSALWCILAHHRVLQVACPCQKPGSEKGLHPALAAGHAGILGQCTILKTHQAHLHTPMVTALAQWSTIARACMLGTCATHAQAWDHLAKKRGVNGVPQHGVEPVSKLVQVLLVSAVLLQMACLARLSRQGSQLSALKHDRSGTGPSVYQGAIDTTLQRWGSGVLVYAQKREVQNGRMSIQVKR